MEKLKSDMNILIDSKFNEMRKFTDKISEENMKNISRLNVKSSLDGIINRIGQLERATKLLVENYEEMKGLKPIIADYKKIKLEDNSAKFNEIEKRVHSLENIMAKQKINDSSQIKHSERDMHIQSSPDRDRTITMPSPIARMYFNLRQKNCTFTCNFVQVASDKNRYLVFRLFLRGLPNWLKKSL